MAPTRRHFVIDGSNIATEGRTTPSLAQLQEALEAFRAEYSDGTITTVVDASFAHRIDDGEREAFEVAEAAGELVSPPAGAIGRGDGFLLQIADRTGATVLSNDSFQEFHAEHGWLFDVGRLIGAKPVPGVGWIFSLRTPVRGMKSRQAMRDKSRREPDAAAEPPPTAATTARKRPKAVTQAIAAATADALAPRKRRPRRRKGPSPEAVNDPAPFLQFLIDHRLGTEVDGTVEEFASHGAFVVADGLRAYLPLAGMGDPPPTRARDVVAKGERRPFVVQAVDAPRRAIEVALPGFAHPAGAPSDETVEAVTRPRRGDGKGDGKGDDAPKRRGRKKAPTSTVARKTPADAEPAGKAATGKAPATKEKATKKTGTVKTGTRKKVAKKTVAKKTAAKKTGAKATVAAKTAATKSTAEKTGTKTSGAKGRRR
jgi:hypothetical protein